MTDKAEPLDKKAEDGLSICLTKSTELNWFNEWSKLCELELNQIKPGEYPLASEIRAEPGYAGVTLDVAPPLHGRNGEVRTHARIARRGCYGHWCQPRRGLSGPAPLDFSMPCADRRPWCSAAFAGSGSLAYAKKDTGPLAEVLEKYNQAKTPKKDAPPGPVSLSPVDCKSFAKDFTKAGEKEKGRESEGLFNAGAVYDQCGMDKDAEGYVQPGGRQEPQSTQLAMNNLGVIVSEARVRPSRRCRSSRRRSRSTPRARKRSRPITIVELCFTSGPSRRAARLLRRCHRLDPARVWPLDSGVDGGVSAAGVDLLSDSRGR